MGSLEFLKSLHLLEFIGRWFSHLLLLVVKHHLFHHSPGLSVKIAELAVLRFDLSGIDLGMMGKDVLPPLVLVHFLEMDMNGLIVLKRPSAVIQLDFFAKFTVENLLFPFETDTQFLLLNNNREISGACSLWNGNDKIKFS